MSQKPVNPYGRPAPKGNADELHRLVSEVPCPRCGATEKHVSIDGKYATVRCGKA